MPEPSEYLAVVNLQQALQGISVGAGYFYDVRGTAVKLDPNEDVATLAGPDGPRPFIVLEVQKDGWQYVGAGGQAVIRQPVIVHWISESNPERDDDLLQTFFRGCADVEKAVALDVQRGTYARETKIVSRSLSREHDGSEVWAIVELALITNRQLGAPTR